MHARQKHTNADRCGTGGHAEAMTDEERQAYGKNILPGPGKRYERRFRDMLQGSLRRACQEQALPVPAVNLRWHARQPYGEWAAVRDELGLGDMDTRLDVCAFLYHLAWDGCPRLVLVGEMALHVDHGRLEMVVRHLHDLKAAGHRHVQAWLVGTVLDPRLQDGEGAEALAGSGAHWFRRPGELSADPWYAGSDLLAALAPWYEEHVG